MPTDFSKNAWNAIHYALTLFWEQDCKFFILNAFQVGTSGLATKRGLANETRLFRLLREESERGLRRVSKKITDLGTNKKHEVTTLSVADQLTNAIAKTVETKEIDLVVMGTKGATGLKEVFMGSNAHKVIKEIQECPLILVPDEFEEHKDLDTLVLATGYEHVFNPQELKPILEISKDFGSKILVAYVGGESAMTPQQQTSKLELGKQLEIVEHEFLFVEKEGSVNETIQKIIEQNKNIHMVAMVNYWHSFFEKLTREPVIKKVSFNTTVPFLVIHLFG